MKEGHNPIDKYSRKAYEEGLARIAENEEKISEHPLQEDLALHSVLRESAGSPYPFEEEENSVRASLEAETADFRREVDKIKKDLWRQLSNAQAEAIKMNDEMESQREAQAVIPKIIEIERDTHLKVDGAPENLSGKALVYGRAVLEVAEDAKLKITERPSPSPSVIRLIFKALKELYDQFSQLANVLVQDRYGNTAL